MARPTSPALDKQPAKANPPDPAPNSGNVNFRKLSSTATSVVMSRAVLLGYVALLIYFAVRIPDTFLTTDSLRNILDQSAVPLILAVGLTFVLAAGEFDLSYTAVVGFSSAAAIVLMTKQGFGPLLACLLTLAVALIVGLIVGIFVTATTASSFIVTLALGSVLTGLELAMTDNKTIYEGIPSAYPELARYSFLTFRLPVWIALAVLLVGLVIMHKSRFGRHVNAVGGNTAAAYFAGVPVRRVRIVVFIIIGVLSGLVALILTSRSASYYPSAATGQLLNTYAAAFLGASVMRRGGFSIIGSTLGVLWIVTLQVGLTLMNEPAWLTNLIQGIVLAAAVLLATRGKAK